MNNQIKLSQADKDWLALLLMRADNKIKSDIKECRNMDYIPVMQENERLNLRLLKLINNPNNEITIEEKLIR